ncbi:hypothetical protein H3C70_03990 [Patescibacteria group bacterium]|nr:hypothetical protein [Patescibacteria group bacterium]
MKQKLLYTGAFVILSTCRQLSRFVILINEMRKKNLLGILALVVFVLVVLGLYFFRRSQSQRVIVNQDAPFEMSGAFAGVENVAVSADAPSLNRVVRGYFDSIGDNNEPFIYVSTQINWPEEEPLQNMTFQVLPQTEYLCWPSSFITGDGTTAEIKDTVYLLDSSHKLLLEGQVPLTYERAVDVLKQGDPVIIALQEPYSENRLNTAFQVAIVGCQ